MRVDRPLLLLLAALTAGCADPEPFVDFGTSTLPTMTKPKDPVLSSGVVAICYSDETPWSDVQALAGERCAAHGLQASTTMVQRWQCRATSPHRATFTCFDPEMLMANGTRVNPFNPKSVEAWEKATGKKAKPHNFMTGQKPAPAAGPETPPAADADAAPRPAGVAPLAPPPAMAPLAPLTPADIAGKPPAPVLAPPQAVPQAPAAPPAGGAYPMDGFTLPQGSWGDHFQD